MLLKDKRIYPVAGLLLIMAAYFWLDSRYPALDEKALMGGDMPISGIAFDEILQPDESDPAWKSVLINTANWLFTNKQGMTFGILFAAGLILLFAIVSNFPIRNRFMATLSGMVLGAPLGVCVNCAAPIAKGVYDGGGRAETSLAAMISSPTLNIIILTMVFAMFPFYLIVIKLGLTLIFIAIGIPIITALFHRKARVIDDQKIMEKASKFQPALLDIDWQNSAQSWGQAIRWTAISFGKSLWYIFKTTVPLMILAGLLGNILITFVPLHDLIGIAPKGNVMVTLPYMGLFALVGLVLPVPITFDVIIAAVLLAGGLPPQYVAILLFSLGIFSIYSFFITHQTISFRIAGMLSIALLGLSVVAGAAGFYADRHYRRQALVYHQQFFQTTNYSPIMVKAPVDESGTGNKPEKEPAPEWSSWSNNGELPEGIRIDQRPFLPTRADTSQLFTKIEGQDVGMTEMYDYTLKVLTEPYYGRGISTGDVDRDGWVDVVIATYDGIDIYTNQNGGFFNRHRLSIDRFNDQYVFNAALADMDSDGWLDLVVTTYLHGNYIAYNQNGSFDGKNTHRLPGQPGSVLSVAVTASDVDLDGQLDLAFGNWTFGSIMQHQQDGPLHSLRSSGDVLLMNNDSLFQMSALSGIPGETLTGLFTDINNDHYPDLIMGIDHFFPDNYYLGDGTGQLTRVLKKDGLIPVTGATSMSITSADINNDLVPEIFLAQTSFKDLDTRFLTNDPEQLSQYVTDPAHKAYTKSVFARNHDIVSSSLNGLSINLWSDPELIMQQVAYQSYQELLSKRKRDIENTQMAIDFCQQFPAKWQETVNLCEIPSQLYPYSEEEFDNGIPTKRAHNLLYMMDEQGRFQEQQEAYGITSSGWSWTGKFADLNHDEWQDLYVINGVMWIRKQCANQLFINDHGKRFVNRTLAMEMDEYLPTLSYSYVDLDLDGDLDIIAVPDFGPIFLYQNQTAGHSIMFELNDEIGNYYGIGSKLYIHYGNDRHQMRELQVGGGFHSFDAPIAHFGLGEYTQIDRLEITWSTGDRSILPGPFQAGASYRITRKNAAKRPASAPVAALY